jgi:hypothetical protein
MRDFCDLMRELIVKLFYMLRFAGRKFELWDVYSINTELLACYFLEYVFSLCVRFGCSQGAVPAEAGAFRRRCDEIGRVSGLE